MPRNAFLLLLASAMEPNSGPKMAVRSMEAEIVLPQYASFPPAIVSLKKIGKTSVMMMTLNPVLAKSKSVQERICPQDAFLWSMGYP